MVDIGYDYATARPTMQALRDAGAEFVVRYLSYLPNAKVASKGEVTQLRDAGIDVGLVWEYDEHDMLGGASAGAGHAKEAIRQAKALGYPIGSCIYYAADFDATEEQQTPINAYLKQCIIAHAGYYRVGVYGGYWVVKRCIEAGLVSAAWQTYAWSRNPQTGKTMWHSGANLRQVLNGVRIGTSYDFDRDERVSTSYLMGEDMVDVAGGVENLYKGMFFGGVSCGRAVDAQYQVSSDSPTLGYTSSANSVFDQLNELRVRQQVMQEQLAALAVGGIDTATLETVVMNAIDRWIAKRFQTPA